MTTKQILTSGSDRETRSLHSASLKGEALPRRVLMAPWGAVESTNGSFIVDEESVRLAIEAFEEHGTDLPIDYEHQTLGGTYSSPSGQAPAAGWIKGLESEPGVGLLARIEWTQQAQRMIASKEYRYLSPVAVIRKQDRKLVAIHSAALTNKPAIRGMQPIVNREALQKNGEEVEPLGRLRLELNLPVEANPEEVLLAASRRLVELRDAEQQRRVEERVGEAMRAGKLVEAQREWAEALVARDGRLFEQWLQTAPVVIQPGLTTGPTSNDPIERRHRAASTRARAEFRTHPLLSRLTTLEAYVANAARECDRQESTVA